MINSAITLGNILALFATVSALCVITVRNPVSAVLWLIGVFVSTAAYLVNSGLAFIGLSYIIVYVGAIAVLFLFIVMILNVAALRAVQVNNKELVRSVDTDNISDTNDDNTYTSPAIASYSPIDQQPSSIIVAEHVTKQQVSTSTYSPIDSIPIAIILAILFFYGISHFAPSIELALPISVLDWINNPFIATDIITNNISNTSGLLVFQPINPLTGYTLITQVQTLGIALYTEGSLWLLLTSVLLLLAILAPIALCMEAVAKTNK